VPLWSFWWSSIWIIKALFALRVWRVTSMVLGFWGREDEVGDCGKFVGEGI